MPKKLTQEQVSKEFTDKGCHLLSEYEGNQKTMTYRCHCGEIAQTNLVGFRKSKNCYKCSDVSAGRKFTYQYVKQQFEQAGCQLLSNEYKGNLKLLDYKCCCGNISKIRFADFKNGVRCQKCKANKSSKQNRTSNDKIIKLCEENECKFIRSWIKCKKTRIEFICKCGRNWEAYLTNFKKYPNCKKCGNKKVSGSNCYMYDPDRDAIAMRKRFRKMCGQHIHRFMKATGKTKTKSTHKLLGYRPIDLQEHILNHPNYKNCVGKEWHVDHIFPIQAFLDHGIHDLRLINNLSNLRPVLGLENLSKADTYDEKEFVKWLNRIKKTSVK